MGHSTELVQIAVPQAKNWFKKQSFHWWSLMFTKILLLSIETHNSIENINKLNI